MPWKGLRGSQRPQATLRTPGSGKSGFVTSLLTASPRQGGDQTAQGPNATSWRSESLASAEPRASFLTVKHEGLALGFCDD